MSGYFATSDWGSYLPRYQFPRLLRVSCGCLGLFLGLAAAFIAFVLPGIVSYMVTLDTYPVLEIHIGTRIDIGDYALELVRVAQDTRCSDAVGCSAAGRVELIFSSSMSNDEYVVVYTEGIEFLQPIVLPQGYLMQVIGVSAAAPGQPYRVQLQVFKPPAPG